MRRGIALSVLARWIGYLTAVGLCVSPALAHAFTVQGKVTTSSQAAIADATVVFSNGSQDVATTQTSGSGAYSVSIPGGTYSVTVQPLPGAGFVRQTQSGVQVQANLTLDVVLVDAVPAQFSGKVVNSAGTAMKGVSVTLRGGGFSYSDATKVDGTFSVAASTAATTLEMRCDGPDCDTFGAEGSGYVYLPPVNLSNGSLTGQMLVWETRTLTGTVTGPGGTPVVGASVQLSEQVSWASSSIEGHLSVGTVTGGSGQFSLRVSPGSASLTVRAPDNSGLQHASTPLVISTQASNPASQNIALLAAPTFAGTVVDGTGKAMKGVEVRLSDDSFSYSGVSNTSGVFSMWAHRDASSLQLSCDSYADCAEFGAEASAYVYLPPVDMTGGSLSGQVLVWQTRVLSGTVTAAGGAPVSGAEVHWSQQASWGPNVSGSFSLAHKTDATGHFSFRVTPGEGTISVTAPAGSGLQNEAVALIIGTGAANPAAQNIVLDGAPVFAGTVLDSQGLPMRGVEVILSSDSFSYRGASSATGAFSISADTQASSLRLECSGWSDCDAFGETGSAYVYLPPVDLSHGSLTGHNLVWQTRGLTGLVTDIDGVPVLGASVAWSGETAWDAGGLTSGWVSVDAYTDVRGAFAFSVSPGSGSLTVVPDEETGLLPFVVEREITNSLSLALLIQFAAEAASESVSAGATVSTDPEGKGATQHDPLETSVKTAVAGLVTIEERALDEEAPTGVRFITQQVSIEAPASSAQAPIEVAFVLDASRIPLGYAFEAIGVYRNGVPVEACLDATVASPDPCLASREQLGDGDVRLSILTSEGGTWNLGVTEITCVDASGCSVTDACAEATCVQQVCRFARKDTPSCLPECARDVDCDDDDWCTNDDCSFGACVNERLEEESCQAECQQASDCNDGNSCTDDTCIGGTCDFIPRQTSACGDDSSFDDEDDDDYGYDDDGYEEPSNPGAAESKGGRGFSLCSVGVARGASHGVGWWLLGIAVVVLARRRHLAR